MTICCLKNVNKLNCLFINHNQVNLNKPLDLIVKFIPDHDRSYSRVWQELSSVWYLK